MRVSIVFAFAVLFALLAVSASANKFQPWLTCRQPSECRSDVECHRERGCSACLPCGDEGRCCQAPQPAMPPKPKLSKGDGQH